MHAIHSRSPQPPLPILSDDASSNTCSTTWNRADSARHRSAHPTGTAGIGTETEKDHSIINTTTTTTTASTATSERTQSPASTSFSFSVDDLVKETTRPVNDQRTDSSVLSENRHHTVADSSTSSSSSINRIRSSSDQPDNTGPCPRRRVPSLSSGSYTDPRYKSWHWYQYVSIHDKIPGGTELLRRAQRVVDVGFNSDQLLLLGEVRRADSWGT